MVVRISSIVEEEAKVYMVDMPQLAQRIREDWWSHMVVKNDFISYDSDSFFRIRAPRIASHQLAIQQRQNSVAKVPYINGPEKLRDHPDFNLDFESLNYIVPIANTSLNWKAVLKQMSEQILIEKNATEKNNEFKMWQNVDWEDGMDHMNELSETVLYFVD